MGLIPPEEEPLETEMTTLSSSLAWEISWTEEPAGCSSWGRKKSDTTESNTSRISSVQLLSRVRLFLTPRTAAH